MEPLFWIQRELARYFPDADFFHGVDLDADGEIQPWEEVRDENDNGEFGDKTDWEFFYYRNEEFLKLFPGPLHWGGIFRVDNPLHDRMSLEGEVLSEKIIDNCYRQLDKIISTLLFNFGLANRNLDETIDELVYSALATNSWALVGSSFSPFFAELIDQRTISTELRDQIVEYMEYELGESTQESSENNEKSLEVLEKFISVERYLRDGQNQQALQGAGRLVKHYPHSAGAFVLRAKARIQLKDFNGAIRDLEEALKVDPKYGEALFLLVNVFVKRGMTKKAERYVLERGPNMHIHVEKMLAFADLFMGAGSDYFALGLYRNVFINSSNQYQTRAAYALTRFWLQAGELNPDDNVLKYMNKAIQFDPSNATYYQMRGDVYYLMKDYEKAISDYNKATGLGLSDPEIFRKRGMSYYKLSRFESAVGDLTKAVQTYSEDIPLNDVLAFSQAISRLDAELVVTADRLIALNPTNAHYCRMRAAAKARLGDCEGSLLDCGELFEAGPANYDIHWQRGNCYFKKGEMEKAIDHFSYGLVKEPRNRKILLWHGKTCLQLKKYREAIRDFESVIALSAGAKDELERDARVLRLEAAKKLILGEDQ